jgi:signal transduction histidine kinase
MNRRSFSTSWPGARDGVRRGLRLTSQFLVLAQREEMQTRAADANLLLENLESFLRYAAGSSVRVVFDLCPTLPNCRVDSSQFAAAMLNLVINARDALPDGGEVRISTARCDIRPTITDHAKVATYVRVRVQDNGLGMPEKVVKRIVELFFTTKGEEGSGLGIPQVCAFMRHMGGHVNVASEQSRGTTFDLLFPAIAPDISGTHGDREDTSSRPTDISDKARPTTHGGPSTGGSGPTRQFHRPV